MEDPISLVEYHLERDIQLWYQLLKEQEELVMWENLNGLHVRYEPTDYYVMILEQG